MRPISLACLAVFSLMGDVGRAQQTPDPDFHPSVARPAYSGVHPRVAIDRGHFNLQTADGNFAPLAALLRADGYDVVSSDAQLTPASLAAADVLIIANARAGEGPAFMDVPAFSTEELASVKRWVERGGALLLIADHAPFGGGADQLANAFGVRMMKGVSQDTVAANNFSNNPTYLKFSTSNRLLGDHPIVRGRSVSERVETVVTFTGQSLVAPPGSTPLLTLSATAWDRDPPVRLQPDVRAQRLNRARDSIAASLTANGGEAAGRDSVIVVRSRPAPGDQIPSSFKSAAGRVQGVALPAASGRVVVLGDAALMSAQIVEVPGVPVTRVGLQVPGSDDQQFALNVMRWLSGLLPLANPR